MKKNTRLALSILAGFIVVAAVVVLIIERNNFGTGTETASTSGGTGGGPAVTGQTFGRWTLACGAGQAANRCALIIRAADQKTGRPVLGLMVTRGPKGNPVLLVRVPPNVAIPAGVTIRPGNGAPITHGFQSCGATRCQAFFLLDDSLRQALATSNAMGVRFVLAGGRPYGLRLPTDGFAAAFAAWQAKSPAPVAAAAPPAPAPSHP